MFESIIVKTLTDERLMSGEKALGIALGNINPITGEVIANFSPCKTKDDWAEKHKSFLAPIRNQNDGDSLKLVW